MGFPFQSLGRLFALKLEDRNPQAPSSGLSVFLQNAIRFLGDFVASGNSVRLNSAGALMFVWKRVSVGWDQAFLALPKARLYNLSGFYKMGRRKVKKNKLSFTIHFFFVVLLVKPIRLDILFLDPS